jgi:hypothetical protein
MKRREFIKSVAATSAGLFLTSCDSSMAIRKIGANEKINAKGYTVHYLFLPDYRTAKTTVAKEGDLVTSFDQAIHIIKDKNATTTSEALEEGTDVEDEEDVSAEETEELFEMDDEEEDEF